MTSNVVGVYYAEIVQANKFTAQWNKIVAQWNKSVAQWNKSIEQAKHSGSKAIEMFFRILAEKMPDVWDFERKCVSSHNLCLLNSFMKKCLFLLISLTIGISLSAQNNYTTERDIPYHTEAGAYAAERCMLDFYYPTDMKDFPTVVWFHGGGLEAGSKEIPRELRNAGLGVIGVNYRLLPRAKVEEIIDDAAAAVAWAFREVEKRGGSARRIFVAGHSAGGYLTDMVVLDKSWLARYGIDADSIAGAFPYSAQVITHYNVRKQQGVGPLTPRLDETAPLWHVRPLPMPMLVLSGDREMELYGRYEEQAYFWRMMRLVGNDKTLLYEFDGYDHGSMAAPAHSIVKRCIHAVCNGQPFTR